MQEVLINDIKKIEKYLKEKQIKSKVIDRMYNLEYKTTESYEEYNDIYLDIVPDDSKIKFLNGICYLSNNAKGQEIFKKLVKLLSLDISKPIENSIVVKTGFSETEYKNKDGQIIQFENVKDIYLNLGVLEYITKTMYVEILNKPYERKILGNSILTDSYLAGEVTRILNFLVFETEDNTKMLKLYLNNKKDVFLNKVEEKLGLSEREIMIIYEISTILLSNNSIKKTMYYSDEYKMKFLKKFLNNSYDYAKTKKIRNAEFFFATEFSRDIMSFLI